MPAEPTLNAHARRYLAGRTARHEIRQATARHARHVLRGFAAAYGHRPVDRLSRADVERWLAEIDVTPASRRTYLGVVRGFARWLVEQRLVRRDPTAGIARVRVPRRPPRALNRADVDRLRHALPDSRARAVVALMLGCGLRVGEVVALRCGDWSRFEQRLHVVGKGGHERDVPVPSTVERALLAYLADDPARGASVPLIRSTTTGRPITSVHLGALMSQWMTAAGIKAHAWDGRGCHSLRHTCAEWFVDADPDLRLLQHLLGHRDLSTTSIYLRRADLGRVATALERSAAYDDGPAAA